LQTDLVHQSGRRSRIGRRRRALEIPGIRCVRGGSTQRRPRSQLQARWRCAVGSPVSLPCHPKPRGQRERREPGPPERSQSRQIRPTPRSQLRSPRSAPSRGRHVDSSLPRPHARRSNLVAIASGMSRRFPSAGPDSGSESENVPQDGGQRLPGSPNLDAATSPMERRDQLGPGRLREARFRDALDIPRSRSPMTVCCWSTSRRHRSWSGCAVWPRPRASTPRVGVADREPTLLLFPRWGMPL